MAARTTVNLLRPVSLPPPECLLAEISDNRIGGVVSMTTSPTVSNDLFPRLCLIEKRIVVMETASNFDVANFREKAWYIESL